MSYHDMVEDLAKGRFGADEVVRVYVQQDHGWGGDRFIEVTVVWDDTAALFDVDKAAGFKSDVRAALDHEGEGLFPVISFLAKSEESQAA